jgi:hypothetical protein
MEMLIAKCRLPIGESSIDWQFAFSNQQSAQWFSAYLTSRSWRQRQ